MSSDHQQPHGIVVSGGASGIGKSCVEVLLRRWPECRVAALDTDAALLERLTTAHGSERVLTVSTDVTDQKAVDEAFDRCDEFFRVFRTGVDALVTCAGVQLKCPSLELSPDDWHRVLQVHLDGTFYCSQSAARRMSREHGGAIVAISSVAETFAWPARLPYAVAKAGISAMVRTLAVEWAELGIRVNAVAPGYVKTPFLDQAVRSGGLIENVDVLHALNRTAEPEEVAKVVAFLISLDASFVTGETVFVDGGFRVRKIR